MSVEENKAVVRCFFEEFFNQWDMDVLDEIAATQFVHHDNATARSLEVYKQYIAAARPVCPESHFTIEDMIAEGEKVAARWTWRGTLAGEWAGIAGSGKQVTGPGITIFSLRDGKIAEVWACWDTSVLR